MRARLPHPYLASGLLIAVGALVLSLLTPAPAPDNTDPSSWSYGSNGSWALFQVAAKLGANPGRITGSDFGASLRAHGTLVEYDPTTPFTRSQVAAVRGFIGRGGLMVLAGGSAEVDRPLLTMLGVETGGRVRAGVATLAIPLRGVDRLRVEVGAAKGFRAGGTGAELLRGSAGPVGVAVALGRGEAVLLASPLPFSNTGLRRADDARFAVLALGIGRGRAVQFDEVHHGYQLGDGVAALLWGTPLGAAAIAAAALALLYLASSGLRLGGPLPPPRLSARRSTRDHLEAMAELYARVGDRRPILGRYRRELSATLEATAEGSSARVASAVATLVSEMQLREREGTDGPTLVKLAQSARRAQLEATGAAQPSQVGTVT